ncbi:RICIN domain-containing protein [Paractinoplanes durhamensis]|uniref:RICIN domain-containing protein n=1 Tax=Paractinoplanes durhamensis TaxID=113563 RepID=UPI003626C56C
MTSCSTKFPNADPVSGYYYNRGPYWWANKNASPGSTRMVLDVQGPWTDNGTKVHLWHWYGGDSQYWCLAPQGYQVNGANVYKFRNLYTGKCLDIAGPSAADGTNVHQWGCTEFDDYRSQQWAQFSANGGYQFRNVYSGTCLDVRNWGNTDGAELQIWTCGDTSKANQIFF